MTNTKQCSCRENESGLCHEAYSLHLPLGKNTGAVFLLTSLKKEVCANHKLKLSDGLDFTNYILYLQSNSWGLSKLWI